MKYSAITEPGILIYSVAFLSYICVCVILEPNDQDCFRHLVSNTISLFQCAQHKYSSVLILWLPYVIGQTIYIFILSFVTGSIALSANLPVFSLLRGQF